MKELIFDYAQMIIAIISFLATILIALKSVVELKKNRKEKRLFSPLDFKDEKELLFQGDIVPDDISAAERIFKENEEPDVIQFAKIEHGKTIIHEKFELKQLDNYYSQALSQSKISFWFSILFASIGFIIIIITGFLYSGNNLGSTIISLISGTIIDSVAALFFVQTRRAQQNMSEFFQKLREDKQYVEARNLCESLNSSKAKDALKIQLALNFSKIMNSKEIGSEIIKECLNNN